MYVISNGSIDQLHRLRDSEDIEFSLSGIRDVYAVYAHDLHPQLDEYVRYRYPDFETAVAVFTFPARFITELFENGQEFRPGNIGIDSINERFVTESLPILRYPTQPVTQFDSERVYAYDIYVEYAIDRITVGRLYNFGGSNGIEYWDITFDKTSDELPSALLSVSFSGRHTSYWIAESWSRLR